MMSPVFSRKLPGLMPGARRFAGGFTVIELMLAVVILAIIVALGAPGLMSFVTQSRMTGQINDILADVSLARNEAASRGVRVAICASNNSTTATPTCSGTDWNAGRIVFVDVDGSGQRNTAANSTELLLKTSPALTGGSTIAVTLSTGGSSTTGPAMIQFRPYGGMATNGQTTLAGSSTILSKAVFTLCPVNTGKDGRVMTIAMTGRPVISRVGC